MISSRANERVKAIRALKNRRERDLNGVFFAEGLRIIRTAIDLKAQIEQVVVAPDRLEPAEADLLQELVQFNLPLLEVTPPVYDSLSFRQEAESLGVVIRQNREELTPDVQGRRCWLALSDIQHPGNLGTIIRTCDAIGGDGVILSGQSTDPYHPIAVRGSLGAIFSQRVLQASDASLTTWLKSGLHTVIGASPQAQVDYREADYGRPVVLVMGNERAGITPAQRGLCDVIVRIPMLGQVDSLNLSVAAALMLYEVLRQQEGRTS